MRQAVQQITILLEKHGQQKLLPLVDAMTSQEQLSFLHQLHHLTIGHSPSPTLSYSHPKNFRPFTSPLQTNPSHHPLGLQALKEKKVLSIILAGGDGTRLGHPGLKGSFPITPIMKKSLFQLHCEKIVAQQKLIESSLPLAILTSATNHTATIEYFDNHHFFGLNAVSFLEQPMLPLYTQDNSWCFTTPSSLAMAPNGNGGLLQALQNHKSLFDAYEHFMVINVDNTLASPYDIPLISEHLHQHAEATLRCFNQNHHHDVVGVLAEATGHLYVIDYTTLKDRSFFPYGNINTLCFSKRFLEKLFTHPLPIHWVTKQHTLYDHATRSLQSRPILKGEAFLSDAIAYADKCVAIDSVKKEYFAPLKSLSGLHDVTAVQLALIERDKDVFTRLTGLARPQEPIELAMEFLYPTTSLLQKCSSLKELPPGHYISPDML